jgi:hypothetical protein
VVKYRHFTQRPTVKTFNGLITTSVERLYQWCAIQTATSLLILAPATL